MGRIPRRVPGRSSVALLGHRRTAFLRLWWIRQNNQLDCRPSRPAEPPKSALSRTPALCVCFAHNLGVGYRTHNRPNFKLPVPLNRRLPRTPVSFSPHEDDFCAYVDVRVYYPQRQHGTLVVAIAAKHRDPDSLSSESDLVIRGRSVVRLRQIDIFVNVAMLEHRSKHLDHIVRIPGECDFLPMRLSLHLLQGFLTDEVVVEFDELPVAQGIRRHVVVLDIARFEATGQGARG